MHPNAAATRTLAHKPSDAYLTLNRDGAALSGQWDVALRDLDNALTLDANGDDAITWGAVRAKHAAITAYARSEDRIRCLKSGFQIHLSKPIDPGELVATVAALASRVDTTPS